MMTADALFRLSAKEQGRRSDLCAEIERRRASISECAHQGRYAADDLAASPSIVEPGTGTGPLRGLQRDAAAVLAHDLRDAICLYMGNSQTLVDAARWQGIRTAWSLEMEHIYALRLRQSLTRAIRGGLVSIELAAQRARGLVADHKDAAQWQRRYASAKETADAIELPDSLDELVGLIVAARGQL